MQSLKMRDQMSGVENAGPENAGTPRNAAHLLSYMGLSNIIVARRVKTPLSKACDQ